MWWADILSQTRTSRISIPGFNNFHILRRPAFLLGIIGEYISGMHFRSMGRPYSVIGETVGFELESEIRE